MHLKKRLRKLVSKVEAREGTDTRGALRDTLTDMIHLCRESGVTIDEMLVGARRVAEEELADEKGEEIK